MRTLAKILVILILLGITLFSMTNCQSEKIYILNLPVEEVSDEEPLIEDIVIGDTIYLIPKYR